MKEFDVIIIGGSSAGLSAGMALGRAMRKVLIIDSGMPCNRQTPHSHNFFTRDGQTPHEILTIAREQTLKYPTITLLHSEATQCTPITKGFEVSTISSETFSAKKIILAAGIKDQMPDIPGFAECWGISIIHCPYCHGYEYGYQPTGIFANGEMAFELAKLISNWTKDLILFTNGKSTLTEGQQSIISHNNIQIIEGEIAAFDHHDGQITTIHLQNGSEIKLKALYARLPFVQHSDIALQLGCSFTDQGHIQVDAQQKTTVPGVYAAGDSASGIRAIANAVNSGTMAGVMANLELINEVFLPGKE
ncbi:NAD(P)/FAD-dependent oxidoreductase [Mucilaginibacter rubeus]|uniref:NAD(P)/FAD-dependent oxidoreductase n=1 Tax=Mucilaginibacter rubeus TaxID=2027860 RepID=A0AAE6JJN7_9SPHI|nr:MULTISPECIES: NAD(P)/FAD-dependent oxidoreductase [Mucilaginibacter]QEM06631.1 NAD(P)/FAD-dependent oxidoreductase [Mucilaginibacter rubeus]QEM19220.1 NAD(P)/FAD-dependent oxidoreductase [Mucilaginibacter gossypii]QTE44236.1 NAD(P)/FAD-dependent oxidoreductase [Mucilaginibacter rubeus]QTE50836.1 NAD(P)/FAD-dependent oxidoreductase [Mucilaginibacter rubeus]QTE55918.1 NAD(P)/FAD-dependent oxidoreductase [Mucilaginibacter rubeus]